MQSKVVGIVAVLFVGCLTAMARADFTLYGDEAAEVIGPISQGTLLGTSQLTVTNTGSVVDLRAYSGSTATITGGTVGYLYTYDASIVDVSGGSVLDYYAYNTSTATITGGLITNLYAYDAVAVEILGPVTNVHSFGTSALNMSGKATTLVADGNSTVAMSGLATNLSAYGDSTLSVTGLATSLSALEASNVDISSGLTGSLATFGTSTTTVSGGRTSQCQVNESSSVEITGGSVSSLSAFDTSISALSGGMVDDIFAYDTSMVALYGKDFVFGTGLSVDASNNVLGTGILSGKWLDGTAWTTTISANDPTASIWLVAEPGEVTPLDGDTNLDGIVDMTDYNTLKGNMGMTEGAVWADGDVDEDGDVDWDDLLLLHAQYGKTTTSLAAAPSQPIPEPATMSLLALGGLMMLRRKK